MESGSHEVAKRQSTLGDENIAAKKWRIFIKSAIFLAAINIILAAILLSATRFRL